MAWLVRRIVWLFVLAFLPLLAGCFAEQSFPCDHARLRTLPPSEIHPDMRAWAAAAHQQFAPLLPADTRHALTTADLRTPEGRDRNVYDHFGLDPNWQDHLLGNLPGLAHSAQISPPEHPSATPAIWPNVRPLTIPADDQAPLAAWLCPPTGKPIPGSCIIFTHGLFGSLDGHDPANQIAALRHAGHTVLAYELRGHGHTAKTAPNAPLTFGIDEARDLLAISRYLRRQHQAQHIGLVAFSISAHQALLAAWLDSRTPDEPVHAPVLNTPLLKNLPAPATQPAFDAGIFLVSPPVHLTATADRFETSWNLFSGAMKSAFQDKVVHRLVVEHQPPSRSMWNFAEAELRRTPYFAAYSDYAHLRSDYVSFVDFHHGDWGEGSRRLNEVRSPLLILTAANDPLNLAQGAAELVARSSNPNCATIILREGGHMGFVALAPRYYYSLMLAFFDPATAPRSVPPQQ